MSNTEQQPRMAYTAVMNTKGEVRLGIATEGEPGYSPVREDSDAGGTFETYDAAQRVAEAYNERLGLTPAEATMLVLTTMGPEGRQ